MINIDLTDTIRRHGLTREQAEVLCNAVLLRVTVEVTETLRTVAAKNLHSTRNRYLKAIVVTTAGRLANSVSLADPMARMIEEGSTAFDIKAGLLASPRVKIDKKGNPYITVPFRQASAGASGENEAFNGGVLPPEVYAVTRQLKARRQSPTGELVQAGSSLQQVPAPFDQRRIRPQITENTGQLSQEQLAAYQHADSVYKGIRKYQQTYQKATQAQYRSFRRVSLASAVNSWIHRGLEPRNFMGQAESQTDVPGIVTDEVNAVLDAFGVL